MEGVAHSDGRSRAPSRAVLVLLTACLLVMCAQGLIVPISDADRVADADEIVRGTLTDVRSQWNDDHTGIVTTASVSVKGRVKGQSPDTFTIAVLGGTADGVTEWVEDEPVLVPGLEAYVFVRAGPPAGVQAHGRAQGLVPVSRGRLPGGSQKKGAGIAVAEYDAYLQDLARYETVARPAVLEPPGPSPRAVIAATPVISSVEPSAGSAGTGTEITITGTGFGTKANRDSMADVAFSFNFDSFGSWGPIYASGWIYYDDYDNPVYLTNANDIVSWTDTQIRVRVPTGLVYDQMRGSLYPGSASSGCVGVLTDAGLTSATKPFTVTFGYGKMKWDAPVQYYVNPGTFGSAGLTAINNAANTWNTANNPGTVFNFNYAGQTTSTVFGKNGQSLISFGPASDFSSSSVIAHANVWTSTGTTIITEADVEYNSGFSWTTGTASGNTMNVEHITLHELGHWLQLRDLYGDGDGYPSDVDKTMFGYTDDSDGNMNDRTLHADDIAGIRWIYPTVSTPVTVTSVTPNAGTAGTTVAITNLAGTGFASDATVKLTRAGWADIAATDVFVASPTKITCVLGLPPSATPGVWNVTVVNPDDQKGTLEAGFIVTVPVTTTVTTVVTTPAPTVITVPGGADKPTDTDGDEKYDDVNGNGRRDFADVVLYFNAMDWIAANEPVPAFDCNANGRVDFADVVWLFNRL